jgi:hypothetical protein
MGSLIQDAIDAVKVINDDLYEQYSSIFIPINLVKFMEENKDV